MPTSHIVRQSDVIRTPRVMQMESMFDVPASEKTRVEWNVDLPLDDRAWNVGLIVGPSGSGKSTIARELFADRVISSFDWPDDKCVLDGFPRALGIKDVVGLLTSVGFSSPPNWLRPFRVLSNGEQFRTTVARAIAETTGVFVIDEFSSVVDRQVAQVASHTIQKAIRRANRQFVAVTCHYDVIDWLQPDWLYQPHAENFEWRCLRRRPNVDLQIFQVDRSAWRMFSKYHYLSGELHAAAQCFGAFVGEQCVAFTSYTHFPHPRAKNIKMGHRLVVLPDWQGLGIGGRLDDWLGQYLYERGFRYHNVVAHPAMIAHYSKSPRWRLTHSGRKSAGGKSAEKSLRAHQDAFSSRRISSSFEYVPPKG